MERYLKDEPKLQSFKKLPNDLDTPWDFFAAPSVQAKWKVEVDPICLEDLNLGERHLDSLSTSSASSGCSGVSWDSALSCAVVVKKERLDDDDDENNSDSYDENHHINHTHNHHHNHHNNNHHHNNNNSHSNHHNSHHDKLFNVSAIPMQTKTENSIELRLVARRTTSDQTNELLPTLTPPSSPESVRNTSSSIEPSELALLGPQGLVRVSTTTGHIPRSAILRLQTTTTQGGKNTVGVTRFIQVSSQGMPTTITSTNKSTSTSSSSSPASPASSTTGEC